MYIPAIYKVANPARGLLNREKRAEEQKKMATYMRGREQHCRRGEPGSALSGGYAPDSAKAEGSSIVDEPGEG